ncbi:MAG: aminotransferase class I/II-fold pyridoxal phosphate-dependent enzyme [Ghiorsea sp.]|nr:aminotransferase class I/II-fold pyridoxal phosphate-dependent enzyme [Ghiorsea sp.]
MVNLPHGGNIEEIAKQWACSPADILDLSTGLHPDGPPTWLGEWLQENSSLIGHYPDRWGEPARSALATYMRVSPENILMLAGAQAAIEILPQALKWQNMAIKQPCYSEPIRAAQRAGCQVIAVDMQATSYPDADCVWITSPHNPFGHHETFPQHQHGVLDESYMRFAERQTLGILPDVIRLGSLTKTFCIPGLRLVYIIAEKEHIQTLQTWLPPWPTSTLATHLLPRLLPQAKQRDARIVTLKQHMLDMLVQHDWQVSDGHASFVLGKPQDKLPDFKSSRILVRHFPEWEGLRGWVRLGFPASTAGWQRLHAALSHT